MKINMDCPLCKSKSSVEIKRLQIDTMDDDTLTLYTYKQCPQCRKQLMIEATGIYRITNTTFSEDRTA